MRAIRAPYVDSLLAGMIHLIVQLFEKLRALLRAELALQFLKRQRDDVIVVRACELGVSGNVEPQLMHQFDVLWPHARRVGTERVLAHCAVRRTDLQRQTRTGLGQPLPRIAGKFRLLIGGELVRKAADYSAGVETLRG